MHTDNLLMYANSEHDANMLYAVGMFAPDPFVYLRLKGRPFILLSDLEVDRARKQAPHCRVLSLSQYEKKLPSAKRRSATLAKVVQTILREHRVKKVAVPANFPHGFARDLRQLKIRVKPRRGTFFAEREVKTAAEVKKISAALLMAEVGLAEAIQVLRNSKIGKANRLLHHNVPLTSEKLRAIIDIAILQAGGLASHTIVAGGRQGCDPHEIGYGPLHANQPIILDIFPRSQKTGYYGDITRTVVRGRATEAVRKAYHTVAQAQELALSQMRDATPCADVHKAIQDLFEQAGYETGKQNGHMEGFFHGSGHGLGLEIHESPRISPTSKDTFQAGQVVTIEPGLYYAGMGGVRLEDVVQITRSKPRSLTKFEKVLEI